MSNYFLNARIQIFAALSIYFLWAGLPVSATELHISTSLSGVLGATQRVLKLEMSADPQLRKLAEYQARCPVSFSNIMVFTILPENKSAAQESAVMMAGRLKEYAAFKIKPIVIVEPTGYSGNILSFSDIGQGEYNGALEIYFKTLKERGVTDEIMGLWVPLPEPNTNSWEQINSNPVDFVAAYNEYGEVYKKYFPDAGLSLLLDNETYLWDIGDTAVISLEPYVVGIDKRYVDSFGLQGFPWPFAGASGLKMDYEAAGFLTAGRAIETADILGTKSLWFNTGTFSSYYEGNDTLPVASLAPGQRAGILDSILGQLVFAQNNGFDVMVNIFAEDKSRVDEGIDWSYWHSVSEASGNGGAVLASFARKALEKGIGLSVFDNE